MPGYEAQPPELIPILSRGKHRGPRTGACFMELVSYLAGERWSDHPACTHPLLAAVARDVNDCTSDAGRPRLAELIPSVIGLTGEDLHIDARIALACIPEPDAMLRALLIDAIGLCATWARPDAGRDTPCDSAAWAAACSLTGTAAAP